MNATRHAFVLVLFLTTLALIVVPGPAAAGSNLALAPGDTAPRLRGFDSDGISISSDYAQHRLTLVNFWATWCEPCKGEMSALQKLHETHAGSDLEIIGVMRDSAPSDAMQRFADELGVTYAVVQPHKEMARTWKGVGILPTTFLIDQQGKVLRRYVGATEEQVLGLVGDVEAVLEGRPLGPMVIPDSPAVATDAYRVRTVEEETP